MAGFWDDYYETGIIPNIWKGITGQQSADLQNRAQLAAAEKQFNQEMDIAKQNFALQQSQYDYQRQLNNLQMEREDNAFQRRVADLHKAGLSPLMANEGAQAGNLLSASAPQLNAESAFSNRAAAYRDAYQRRMQADQFAKQLNLQTAQMTIDVLDKAAQAASRVPSMLATNDQRKWNNAHGYRNQDLTSALINAVEKLVEKRGSSLNFSSVGENFSRFQQSSIDKMNDLGKNISKAIDNIAEDVSDSTSKFNQYGFVQPTSKYGHMLDNENYDNDRPTPQLIKEEVKEKFYKSQLKRNNDDVTAAKLWDTDDYLKKHISKEDWLKTDWQFRSNYLKYGYFKK